MKQKSKSKSVAPTAIYQLKITLRVVRPPIWRRIQTPGNITLARLHRVIQTAMGWSNSHLHCFRIGDRSFSSPYPGVDFEDSGDESDRKVRLDRLCGIEGEEFEYEYDFGDGWEHAILVEKIIAPEKGVRYPVCLAGKRACPPEDCGGPYRYMDLLEALQNPKRKDHEELMDWIGGEWDAQAFNLRTVNSEFADL